MTTASPDRDRESTEGPERAGLTLLVADDDSDMRLYVRRCVLSDTGPIRRVLEAADGESALEMMRMHRPDLVACDVLMPRLGGLGVCERVRSDPDLADTPVLLLTGLDNSADVRRRAKERGADGVLVKPFNHQRLCRAIDELLEGRLDPGRGDSRPRGDSM